ncbi:MAG TPA: hypothetical protein VLJ58_21310 [Ramlibacter sp.]|nr:hypothetical protein [Ramlibacter sp.]
MARKPAKAASTRIDALTPEQAARFADWTKQWIEIGLSTEPADFDAATEAALRAYKLANLEKPMVVLRMGSPYGATLGGTIAWAMLRELGAQVESQVWSQVRSQVESQVGSQVESQVWSQVRSQVESQVESQVWSQVESQVESQVGSQVGSAVNNDRGGAFWASWCAYVSFFRDVMGWKDPVLERFTIDEALTKSCGWVWWHENVLAISDRPTVIRRDDSGRLHGEKGPSIAYRDGWSLYHWHGVAVPEEWITRKAITPTEALHWPNVEQRRAACEILGWANILNELNAKVIDKDDDEEIGSLLEVNLPDSGPERFLSVRCGTGRRFALPVPREVDTALAANAWTYGLDRLSFKPEIRT